ncbi:MAG: CPBP family intramembrane metalloprotease [Planctomycetota bacterium]|nr:MAG: CPBP family intramembrane metalloprotease [Planctomycetota bacterium]
MEQDGAPGAKEAGEGRAPSEASKALLFLVFAFATAAGAAAGVSSGVFPEAVLNAWPLGVGVFGFLFVPGVDARRRGLYLGLAGAAFLLELLGAEVPLPPFFLGLARLLLGGGVLWALGRRPVEALGATLAGARARELALAALVGLLPTAGPWLALWLARPAVLAWNPAWRYAGEGGGAAATALAGAAAILFANTVVGEEAGWRGYLLRELRGRATRRRLVWGTALLFACWHLPFDLLVARMDGPNLVVNALTRYLMGLVYVHLFVGGRGSLLPVSVAHVAHNFVLYQLVGPRGLLATQPAGLEALVVVAGYLLGSLFWVFFLGRRARAAYAEWVRSEAGP